MSKNKIAIFVMALSLFACADTVPSQSHTLYQYKSAYVGDNSKTLSVINLQPYPKGVQTVGIEILSQNTPYGLKVYLSDSNNVADDNLFKNAIITFALIDNLDNIYYIDKNSNQTIAQYNRDDSEYQLKQSTGKTIKDIGANAQNLEDYLNQGN